MSASNPTASRGYLPNQMVPLMKLIPLSLQVVIVSFAATTLVPLLVGVPVSNALLSSGVATICATVMSYLLFGKMIPLFYGSSFSFIAVMVAITKVTYGQVATPDALATLEAGVVTVGVIEILIGYVVRRAGLDALNKVLPPAIIGPVVMVIGLALAFAAMNMLFGGCCGSQGDPKWVAVGIFTLIITALTSVYLQGKGFAGQISLLIGALLGYVFALLLGLTNLQAVAAAPLFAMPTFVLPNFTLPGSLGAVIAISVMTVAVIPEMIGHLSQISLYIDHEAESQGLPAEGIDKLQGGNLQLAGLGDIICGMLTGVPGTSYAEGAAAAVFSRAYSGYVYIGAGVIVLLMGFSGTLAALINSIPTAVIGGIAIPMFGAIALQGVAYSQKMQVDYFSRKNLILGGIILMSGVSGIGFPNGLLPLTIPVLFPTGLPAIATGIVVAILLNLAFEYWKPSAAE